MSLSRRLRPHVHVVFAGLTLVTLLTGCPGEVPAPGGAVSKSGDGGKWTAADPGPIIHVREDGGKPTVAYVTNGIASFWVIAEAGARAAGEQFGADVEIRMPPDGVADQKRMLEELVTRDVDGIAVSPIDPENQTDLLNTCAEQTNLITHDSDAPKSNRICYIGMSNYDAGRMCGELVRDAMPEGGELMIFVGRIEQDNARLRRQGLIDELLKRSHDPSRYDDPGKVIEGEGFTILGTRTDGFDFGKAKSLAEDALTAHPNLRCLVGLFAYNPPNILEAVRGAGKLGKVQVVGFDEADETLQAITDGHCFGTVVQDPYRYGFESVRVLAALSRGDDSVLPEGGFLDIPAQKITKENVAAFRANLKSLVGE
ncbi:MAG: sugar-binding protein [Planctomycetaceae bacterium]|nr:sugar-binding protein [Planctomycetaceae bacterium]